MKCRKRGRRYQRRRIWTISWGQWRRLLTRRREKHRRRRRTPRHRLTQSWRPRRQGAHRRIGGQPRGSWPVISYRLWRKPLEGGLGELVERDRLGVEVRSQRQEELRRRWHTHRLSTVHSSGRLRRGHMGERDHRDSDRHNLRRTRGQQQGRQIRRSNDTTEGTAHRGGYGPLLEKRRRTTT
jgi:hypothetical protein